MTDRNCWLNGVTWPRPQAWNDRSMIIYAGPSDSGEALQPNVTLNRDERLSPSDPQGESFLAYVARQGAVLAAALPGFERLRDGPLPGASYPTQEALFRWRSGVTPLTQWVVWMSMPDGSVISFTATAISDRFDQLRPWFEASLRSLQLDPRKFPTRPSR